MPTDYAEQEQPAHDMPDDNVFAGDLTLEEALRRLRLRLLDLTGRNRLLNFKHSIGKSLQFVNTSPEVVFGRLYPNTNASTQINSVPEPPRTAWTTVNGRLTKPDVKAHAASLGYDTSYELPHINLRAPAAQNSGSRSQSLFYAEDLGRHCRKIEREAKLAIEETGANMLYLVFGFLDYPENSTSDKLYRAPLVCLPVRIDKFENGPFATFNLAYTGEELADNLSLREKVNRDFGITLPEFGEDDTLADYFNAIEEVIENQPQWRLRRMISLTLLSFANMLLVRDLNPENWANGSKQNPLLHHPMVRRVFEGASNTEDASYGEEYSIDDHRHSQLPLIYDADSSQHSALIDVIEGKNLVIEGPPGTGKSQTITNLIASALYMGKKVLFVSEKLAALEVVKARLSHAGLENFILELHGNKTNKKRVIEDIERRKAFRPRDPSGLDSMLESLEKKCNELKAYADLLNGVHGNSQNLTVHKILWRSEKFRTRIEKHAELLKSLSLEAAPSTATTQFHSMYDTLKYVARNFDEIGSYGEQHPFWGFFPEEIKPGQDLAIQNLLNTFAERFEHFLNALTEAAELLGGHRLNMSSESANSLIGVLGTLAPAKPEDIAFDLLPSLFTKEDPSGAKNCEVVVDLRSRIDELKKLESMLSHRWLSSEHATNEHVATAATFNSCVQRLGIQNTVLSYLPSKLTKAEGAANVALQSIAALQKVAEMAGLPSDGSPDSISKLRLVLSLADSAPDDMLYLRHEGLRHPHAHEAIKKSKGILEEIKGCKSVLNTRLYLDMAPTEQELKSAILVLREGDAWYRVFQGGWRKAIAVHRQLQREKVKTNAAARLTELEELLSVTQKYEAWRNDGELRTFANASFKDDQTPLHELAELTGWVDTSVKCLQSAQIGLHVFDPLTVSMERLAQLRNIKSGVEKALADLAAFESVQKQEFPALKLPTAPSSSESWRNVIAAIRTLLTDTKNALSDLDACLNQGSLLCSDVQSVVRGSHRLPLAKAELDAHTQGSALLGPRFSGCATDLEPVEGAVAYGRLIKNAKLPKAIEAILISEASIQNHGSLSGLVNAIHKGWEVVEEFAFELSQHGRFEPVLWVSPESLADSEYVSKFLEKIRNALACLDKLQVWSQYVAQRAEAFKERMGPFVSLMELGSLPSEALPDAFAYRFYASIAESLFRAMPQLSRFNGVRHSTIRAEFAELDKEIIKLRGQQIACRCVAAANLPAGHFGARVGDKTEMALVDHLISLTQPRTPVRQILKRAGRAVQELKPCFMMGPQAVAQFLEPGQLHFDIVVMDEASQLKPEEAIGAIARGKQLVVVGDPKQLPPTAFFSRQGQTADGDDSQQTAAEDAESILDVCIGHFQPVRTLRWHYRSRHESLIAFSNHYFYKGKLFVFPSPYPKGKALGLHYMPVPNGVYENQMNIVEAKRVVDAIVDHIHTRPEDSLGVVTLNIKQRDLIAELWEERRKSIPDAEQFEQYWGSEGMGLFFKNLENVQGDERDCILISTTFGKPKGANVVRQNFGPISRQGGWRRLNVLFTRARKSIGLVTSMQPEDIVADSDTPDGTKALRNYLEYARSGYLPQDTPTGLEPDSDFEVSVIDLIESWGYSVTPQLGVAGFRIDIAVKHPEYPSIYLAAVECDGATYHSAVSVRDRDRIRQEILESLGWKDRIWRIWSTDWFRNPLSEAKKLLSFLEGLRDAPVPAEFAVEDDQGPSPEYTSNPVIPPAPVDEVEDEIELLDEEDEALEVEEGDLVTYHSLGQSDDQAFTVRITHRKTDPAQGLLGSNTPLAQILLGATVGDEVVLRVPGQTPKAFVIRAIKRVSAEAV